MIAYVDAYKDRFVGSADLQDSATCSGLRVYHIERLFPGQEAYCQCDAGSS